MQRKAVLYDKGGDQHYDYISAWIKATRGSDPDASLYYLAAMLEGGEDPRFIARRMIILASEDVGNADPQALPLAVAAAHAVEHVGLPECQFALAQAAIYLSLAPKSNAATRAIGAARAHIAEHGAAAPPGPLRSAAYPAARKLGRGQGYEYPHGQPGPRQRPGAPARRPRGPAPLRARRRGGGPARAARRAAARAGAGAVSAYGRSGGRASALYDRIGRSYAGTRAEDPRIAAAVRAALGDARTVAERRRRAPAPTSRADLDVTAVEPSAVMRAQRPPGAAPCVDARAEALPFPDGAFDAAMAVFSDHHWPDRAAGPARAAPRGAPAGARAVGPVVRGPAAGSRATTSRPSADGPPLRDAMAPLGAPRLAPLPVPPTAATASCSPGGRGPEALLDPAVRANISVFALLGPEGEAAFVARLGRDLADGTWDARNPGLRERAELDVGLRLVVA